MSRLSISLIESEQAEVSEICGDGVIDTPTAGDFEETMESLAGFLQLNMSRIVPL